MSPVGTARLGREWRLKNWGALALMVALWSVVMTHLAVDWRFDPEYRFGWSVPAMLAGILANRLGKGRPSLTANRARMPMAVFLISLAALAAWPITRVIGIANPDWHLITWLTAMTGLILTLATLHSMGGAKMIRQYGIPFLMVIAVVPWPFFLEQHLIATLKGINATIVTELLHLAGIAAVREPGGIISMANAVLGIEEGCTGIRSLHLCLAVALFWGEWFRLPLKSRASLVGLAFIVAIVVNVARTVSLALIAHRSGTEALDQWHDVAGILAQVIVVGICWILTGWLIARRQRWSRSRFLNEKSAANSEAAPVVAGIRLRGIAFCLATVWILGSEAGARFWFSRTTGDQMESVQPWRWSIPPAIEGLRPMRLPTQSKTLLAADEAFAGTWSENTRNRPRYIYGFHWLEWRPAALFATHHRPEDCLPGSGFELIGPPQRVSFNTNSARPFEINRYSFQSSDGVPLTVFHGIYADDKFTEGHAGGLTRQRRLQRAMHGEGFPETRLLEVIFWDTSTDEASAEMEHLISSIATLGTKD